MTSLSLRKTLLRWFTSRPAVSVVFLGFILLLSVSGADGMALSAKPKPDEPYALIFGTVWGPDNLPVYGVKVKIRREHAKKVRWELHSDHNGEFAQRVPAGKQDYIISADVKDFKSHDGKKLQADEVKVHVENDEQVDTGLHLK